jgi:ribosomal-protein-alanine N-acetyltransferase
MAKAAKKSAKRTASLKEQPFLRGQKVYLRALAPEDVSNDYLAWLNDPEVLRYRMARLPTTRRQLVSWVENLLPADRLVLTIRLNDSGRHVGNISLSTFEWTHGSAELAIMIGAKDIWGMGVGTESIELITGHAFTAMGLHRLWAESANPSFNNSMKKLNWTHEGTKREAFFVDGKHVAIECWGLLATQWPKQK